MLTLLPTRSSMPCWTRSPTPIMLKKAPVFPSQLESALQFFGPCPAVQHLWTVVSLAAHDPAVGDWRLSRRRHHGRCRQAERFGEAAMDVDRRPSLGHDLGRLKLLIF